MFFRQVYEEGLAQASYVIGCQDSGQALVVDPRRDVDIYDRIARENDLTITAVTETHIHADFLSGARELAAACDATLHVSGAGGEAWRYKGLPSGHSSLLSDGDVIRVGAIDVRALHTPGHTPEHLTFTVSEGPGARGSMMALTGDFVFVGDIGRPDLLEEVVGVAGSAESGARTMYASLRDKFSSIADYTQIWPAHGAGSACGKALAAVPASTAGYERLTAWWSPFVTSGAEERFVQTLLDGQPDAPAYFLRMKQLNRDGAPILGRIPTLPRFGVSELRSAIAGGATVIDSRTKHAFQARHIQGALSIPDESTFATRAAWFAPYDLPIVLVASPSRVDGLVRALLRVGLDSVVGFVSADDTNALEGSATASMAAVDVGDARAAWQRGSATILDVRTTVEYREGHIPGALHVPAQKLASALDRIPRDRPIFVHCAGGGRSNAAASLLAAGGFERVSELEGGLAAWEESGGPIESDVRVATVG
jgi:hydroxyacylglutathione hydrolase